MYQTTAVGRMEHKTAGVKTVWHRAPSGVLYGFDDEQVLDDLAAAGAGPAGVSLVDGAGLERAKAAGLAALREGFGGVLPDGQAPCGTCPPCQVGRPAQCRRPLCKAEARLRAGQQRDDDRARQRAEGRALLAELELTAAELAIELAR
jgi:hypothetical protein